MQLLYLGTVHDCTVQGWVITDCTVGVLLLHVVQYYSVDLLLLLLVIGTTVRELCIMRVKV